MNEKMDQKQLIKIGLLVVVVLIVIWQIYGLLASDSSVPPPAPAPVAVQTKSSAPVIQSANLIAAKTEAPLTEREKQLIKLQQDTNAKYLMALSDLQMLKINLQIAELNRSIMRARLDTANDEKKLVNLIEGPQSSFAQQPIVPPTPIKSAQSQEVEQPMPKPKLLPQFTVISVSQLQGKWSAVIGYQGKMQNVSIGDALPDEQGKVIKIDRAGVVVERDKETARVNILSTI